MNNEVNINNDEVSMEIIMSYLHFILTQLEDIRDKSQKLLSKEVFERIEKKLDLIINAIKKGNKER